MGFDYAPLAQGAVGTSGGTSTIYTNPSGTTSYVRQIWLHVTADGLTNFSETSTRMMLVPDNGGVVGVARTTEAFFSRSLATNETYLLDCGVPGIVLGDTNDTLQMWHPSQTTINYIVTGGKET